MISLNVKRIISRAGGAFACIALAAVSLCGCVADEKPTSVLDPARPVQIELWTYYVGAQQQAFEQLVEEFNNTKGEELGVVVSQSSQGGVNELASAVTKSAQGLVGSSEMPDAFLSYVDTAYVINNFGRVADPSPYFSDDDKAAFVESFLHEGDIEGDGGIKVFPVSKATETLQINLTDWNKFAQATGASLDSLRTIEGITAAAEQYYRWTDAQTPGRADDGRPLFGRDAMANYFITGSLQLGESIFQVENDSVTLNLDPVIMRRLWDNYYVPMVNGHFSAAGRFRSDAVKVGDLVCYVGSSSSVVYFPQEVTIDDSTSYSIELASLPDPVFKGGIPCAPQQGAGFVVTKADEKTEMACVEFLKWVTAREQNTNFSISAGYVPVAKDALTQEHIEAVAAQQPGTFTKNYLTNLPATLETIQAGLHVNQPFEGSVATRKVLENSLSDKAKADQEAVQAAVDAGTSREEAAAAYTTDAEFSAWFATLQAELQQALTS